MGVIRLNLGDYIKDKVWQSDTIEMPLEKCPDKEAKLRFKMKTTLIKETFTSGDAVSLMSEAISCDSGPETDYNFQDLEDGKEEDNEPKRSLSGFRKKLGGNLSGRPVKTVIKPSDSTKPPL